MEPPSPLPCISLHSASRPRLPRLGSRAPHRPRARRALGEGEAAGPGGAGRTPGCYVSGRERGSWTRPRPLTCARRRAACLPRDRRPHCSSASTRGREAAAAGEKSSAAAPVSWLGTLPSAQWLRGRQVLGTGIDTRPVCWFGGQTWSPFPIRHWPCVPLVVGGDWKGDSYLKGRLNFTFKLKLGRDCGR